MATDPTQLQKPSHSPDSRPKVVLLFALLSVVCGCLAVMMCAVLWTAFDDLMTRPVFGNIPDYAPTFQSPTSVMCFCFPFGVAAGILSFLFASQAVRRLKR